MTRFWLYSFVELPQSHTLKIAARINSHHFSSMRLRHLDMEKGSMGVDAESSFHRKSIVNLDFPPTAWTRTHPINHRHGRDKLGQPLSEQEFWTPFRGWAKLAKLIFNNSPVNQKGKLVKFMEVVQNVFKPIPEQAVLMGCFLLHRLH